MAARDKSKRAALKSVVMDRSLPVEDRFTATLKLAQLPRNGAKVRVRLRCAITGRSRGNYRKFKICRVVLRDLGSSLIPKHEAASARERVLAYFQRYPRTIIDGDELMVVSGIAEWARRVRKIRVQFG